MQHGWALPVVVARIVAPKLPEALDRQFTLQCKPGAGSNIAAESVLQASGAGVD